MRFKRFLATLISAVVVLSIVPAMTFTVSAADVHGDWDTYRSATDYKEPDPETGEIKTYKPAPGYTYTDEGFTTIPADYTNTTPFMTVQSKEKQSLQDGVYMEFRVDDYSYGGEDGASDHWIAISLWSQQKVAPGNVNNGEGWLCLLRGAGNGGNVSMESYNTTATVDDVSGTFVGTGMVSSTPSVDDEGREVYTFEVAYDGTSYDLKLNGVSFANCAAVTEHLDKLDSNGEFYVGVTLYSTAKNGTASMTILKYGTDVDSATVPVGSDSKEPEENINVPPADIADPSTVPENQPALYWDAATVDISTGGNLTLSPMGDNSYHITATESTAFFSWSIARSLSYEANDFPVLAILIRDFWGDDGSLYYCAGNVVSANANYLTGWSPYDGDCFGENNEYVLVLIDLSDMWDGRINNIRLDFGGMEDDESREFDICWMGFFRSYEEAEAFNATKLEELGVASTPSEETTEAATVEQPDETETSTVSDTDAETNAGSDTSVADTTASSDTDTTDDTGCGAVVGMGAFSAVWVALAAAVALKKKD